MTDQSASAPVMKKTLGLTGVTVNAMALIAPGAFLWITYQLQAAQVGGDGNSTAPDMWTGIVAALVVAFLTAFAFSELAHRYPDAGAGSSYYFAEKAFIDREEELHRRWGRIAKFITGWAAHLFYWVYPGVMVAFMATLIVYIAGQFNIGIPIVGQIAIAVIFSVVVGMIAVRGISGSTNASIIINIIQLTALVIFSIMAIIFRLTDPLKVGADGWFHPAANSIIIPHSLGAMLFQSTIAILILVGFESSTALGAEAINPKRDIPRGVILSLIIQGLFAYLFEYFAANFAMNNKLVSLGADGTPILDSAGKALTGMSAAAASGAPIGDLARQIGDALLGGNNGFILMVVIAITVGIAVLGTTLAAMNTGVRISFAMAQDDEMPEIMGALHGKYATPHIGVWIMVTVSAILGAVGVVGGVVALTGITLASNFGTFALYALICGLTIVAFAGRKEFNLLKHGIVPLLGLITNIGLMLAIIFISYQSGGDSAKEANIALGIAGAWLLVSVAYLVFNSRTKGKAIVPPVGKPAMGAGD